MLGVPPIAHLLAATAAGNGYSMAFFENHSGTLVGEAQMHRDEVLNYSQYDLWQLRAGARIPGARPRTSKRGARGRKRDGGGQDPARELCGGRDELPFTDWLRYPGPAQGTPLPAFSSPRVEYRGPGVTTRTSSALTISLRPPTAPVATTSFDELQTVAAKDYGDALDDAEVSLGRWIRCYSQAEHHL